MMSKLHWFLIGCLTGAVLVLMALEITELYGNIQAENRCVQSYTDDGAHRSYIQTGGGRCWIEIHGDL